MNSRGSKKKSRRTDVDPIYRLGQHAARTGIPDLAENIDHYLYGHPKVSRQRKPVKRRGGSRGTSK